MGLRESLDTDEFADLIYDVGTRPTLYRRHMGPCPNCQSSLEGRVINPGCELCGGTGELFEDYEPPADSVTGGQIALQGATVGRTYAGVQAIEGDITCVFLDTDYPMGFQDRLYVEDRFHDATEILRRGSTGLTDALTHRPVKDLVSLYLPTGKATSGFQLSEDATAVEWGIYDAPAAGTSYTVSYRFFIAYRVPPGTTLHRIRATNGDPFPHRVLLRRFLGTDTDVASGEIL